jgi:hypothetical protein
MVNKINYCLCFIFLFYFSGLTQSKSKIGYLSVESDASLDIYIDTTYIASHSFSYLSLAAGKYTLYAYQSNSLKWNQSSIKKPIEIKHGEHLSINLNSLETFRIYSTPFNSDVYANGTFLGKTPLAMNLSPVNGQALTIRKMGFEDYSLALNEDQREYQVQLRRLENHKHNYVLKSGPEKSHFKWYREGLIVTSVVSSWASFFYKRKADEYYDRYMHTADPFQMVMSFRRTQDFDRYADIALGISLVSLGIYLFILIID